MIPALTDIKSRGTIIVGAWRCGSHFVQDLCVDQANELDVPCQANGEFANEDSHTRFDHYLDSFAGSTSYNIVIVNDLRSKLEFLARPDLAPAWHVVRVVHRDPQKWFRSYYFWSHPLRRQGLLNDLQLNLRAPTSTLTHARLNGHPVLYDGNQDAGDYYDNQTLQYISSWSHDQGSYVRPRASSAWQQQNTPGRDSREPEAEFGHHNTPAQVYQFITSMNQTLAKPGYDIEQLGYHMVNHFVSQMLPCDIELAYQDLPSLANKRVRWVPNTYPDDAVWDSEHRYLIDKLLTHWPQWPGTHKATK